MQYNRVYSLWFMTTNIWRYVCNHPITARSGATRSFVAFYTCVSALGCFLRGLQYYKKVSLPVFYCKTIKFIVVCCGVAFKYNVLLIKYYACYQFKL
jgi:hypothetical protein